ncbi:hypothetical protein FNV43_RR26549 [Rhamnella rubrinervis]|uniref:Uncharacterized protein n=1 Tax=Rhamnella rubrinervis TaxID=2594499 RepID=A0A8K0DMS2_9ROSA|nr:hypothetical protein FNV43_RR26549 [Rhamnella rubrinervis]
MQMAMSKQSCVQFVCMVALLVCSICIGAPDGGFTDGRIIGYEPIHKGEPSSHCKGSACLPPPGHAYGRGCEKIEECRGAPPAPLLVCSICVGDSIGAPVGESNGRIIYYQPIHKGNPSARCKGSACLPPPGPYDRGCNKINRCRGGP